MHTYDNGTWNGFDLSERMEKHRRAFALAPAEKPLDVPVIGCCPTYFLFGSDVPHYYYADPEYMLAAQLNGAIEHLKRVDDDYIPYFMPWFGTGVIASAFGCEVEFPDRPGLEPKVTSRPVKTPADIARLKMPDPEKDGLMPEVLRFIDHAMKSKKLPVGLTDMNSPLSTAAQICGYDNLFIWMYEEPDAVHELMDKICEAFCMWVTIQKEHADEPIDASSGLQGVWSPPGVGFWMSDDDLVMIGPDEYSEFVVPHYSRVFSRLGGGSLHYCGKGSHQLEAISGIGNVKAINNSPMAQFDDFAKLYCKFHGRAMIQVQDIAPADPEAYYAELFEHIGDPGGMLFIVWCTRHVAMNGKGGSAEITRDIYDTANRTVGAIRSQIAKRTKQHP